MRRTLTESSKECTYEKNVAVTGTVEVLIKFVDPEQNTLPKLSNILLTR